ncbi:hypothetical protein ACFUTX_15910 [Microbacterium sp. NPDC057407]|uniref:hypothetical protein n=1 Tax=Microbacterium sp. NPDC057407 TaxID=3346120 RepID=UPI00366E0FBF
MATTRDEAREAIQAALLQWRDVDGVADPTIPVYTDVDGDGVPDVYGLDAEGRLELRPSAWVTDTVSVSDGSGIEGGVVGD